MLTGSLLAHTRRQGRLVPRRLDPADPALLDGAARLLALVEAHQGRTRGELEEALRAFALPGVQPKVTLGLAKLLLDRCAFEVGAAADPPALRAALFDGAAAAWREHAPAALPDWRGALLAHVAAAHELAPGQVEAALYADLPENQRLASWRAYDPEALLFRYNVAQVQGQLLRAERMTIHAEGSRPERLRHVFRALKFHGLLFQVEKPDSPGEMTLAVDGPLSVLEHGSRYGLALANFYPALLLWREPWRAEVRLAGRPGRAGELMALAPHPDLRSHYPDHGQWVPEEVSRFVEGFNALGGPWRARAAEEVVALPGNDYLIPDFELTRPRRRVYLEVLRYPAPEQLAARLRRIEQPGAPPYVVACRGVPAILEAAEDSPCVHAFRRTLLPGQVAKFMERFDAR